MNTPSTNASSLLQSVAVTSAGCADRVTFGFVPKNGSTPNCRVGYQSGPFSNDASGAPVSVSGHAFVVVRCSPAYSYDPESGRSTYTGPKRLAPTAAPHVQEIVETGDFEGVLTWVIGLDSLRPFGIAVTGTGAKTLVVTFS